MLYLIPRFIIKLSLLQFGINASTDKQTELVENLETPMRLEHCKAEKMGFSINVQSVTKLTSGGLKKRPKCQGKNINL